MSKLQIVGSVINPLSLTPALWIDFSDASTVTLSGSDITQVNDKSGNGRNFTQGTAGNRPSYQTAVQNGLAVARFDGTHDRLELGSTALAQNIGGVTIYVLRKWANSPATTRWAIAMTTNVGTTARAGIYGGASSGKSGTGGRRLDANSFAGINSTNNVSTSVFQIDTGVFDYTNSDLFLYNMAALENSTTSFQSNGSTSNTASAASFIGSAAGGLTQFFDGDIAEILVYHAAHDAATRQRVWSYLRTKWAL